MIKNSLKTFGKNLVFVFIPMGILYLFLLIAVFCFLGSLIGNLGNTLKELFALVHVSAENSSSAVNDFLAFSFGKIDWNADLFTVVRQLLNFTWLKETVAGFFETLNASTESFGEDVNAILTSFLGKLKADIAVAAALCCLGILLAVFATRFALRANNAKRNVKQFLISHTLVPLAQGIVIVLFFVLYSFLRLYGLLAGLALLVLLAVLALLSSWMIHGKGILPFKKVLTAKNILKYIAALAIIFLIDVVVIGLLAAIHLLLAAMIGVPFAIYSLCISDVAKDRYVRSLTDKIILPPDPEPEPEPEPDSEKE